MSSGEVRKFVLLESPFSAPDRQGIVQNVSYAMIAARDSIARGEAPYASHLFFTQMLDDTDPYERMQGINAGLAIGRFASMTAVYDDLGVSRGMEYGIENARKAERPIEYRQLFTATMSAAEISDAIAENSPLDEESIARIYARIL